MTEYKPSVLLRNGHFNTMYTALYRKPPVVSYERERIITHDEDFLDLDWIKDGNSKVAVLCHGLEGSSDSKYIKGTSLLLSQNGFDICAMNYRFCSGEINRKPQMYHSGWTPDLHTVLQHLESAYDEIFLVGFSLGGNLILKYLGEDLFKRNLKLTAACAVSVPLNLLSSSLQMEKLQNRLYTWRFLKTLNHKVRQKNRQFPDLIDTSHIAKVKSVKDFDDYYTGPLNGFKDAEDYYQQCSSDQFLPGINIPTLVLNALDDPFLGPKCFPPAKEIKNSRVNLQYSQYGGHVGYYQSGPHTWCEEKILAFFKSRTNF